MGTTSCFYNTLATLKLRYSVTEPRLKKPHQRGSSEFRDLLIALDQNNAEAGLVRSLKTLHLGLLTDRSTHAQHIFVLPSIHFA